MPVQPFTVNPNLLELLRMEIGYEKSQKGKMIGQDFLKATEKYQNLKCKLFQRDNNGNWPEISARDRDRLITLYDKITEIDKELESQTPILYKREEQKQKEGELEKEEEEEEEEEEEAEEAEEAEKKVKQPFFGIIKAMMPIMVDIEICDSASITKLREYKNNNLWNENPGQKKNVHTLKLFLDQRNWDKFDRNEKEQKKKLEMNQLGSGKPNALIQAQSNIKSQSQLKQKYVAKK